MGPVHVLTPVSLMGQWSLQYLSIYIIINLYYQLLGYYLINLSETHLIKNQFVTLQLINPYYNYFPIST